MPQALFYIIGKSSELSYDIKTLREDAHANAKEICRLKATRLRRRILRGRILFYGSFNVVTFGLVTALIAESFRDDKERGVTVGYYQGLGCVHGVVISILAGRLATVNWRYAQLLNFIPVIVVPLLFFFIPHTPPERKAAEVRPDENREAFGDIMR